VTIRFYSEVVQFNESGNASLVPSNHLVNITVLDVPNNVVVDRGAVPLFLGRGEFKFPVEALWTSTRLNVSVVDYASGLWGYAEVRTHMSDPYLLWRQEVTLRETVAGPMAAMRADLKAAQDSMTVMGMGTVALAVILVAVLFLRIEHGKARSNHRESLADRILLRLLPSNTDTFLDDYFDPKKTWDVDGARSWGLHRRQGLLHALRAEADGINAEADAIEESLKPPTTLPFEKGATA